MRNLFHISLIIGIAIASAGCTLQNENLQSPNIIVFFTDDQGYGDVGCYGAEGFQTPNLDSLAVSGIRFTDFYVAASVCTPSRAALLTGKYPIRVGLHKAVLFPYSEHGLSVKETTLPELLKGAGYATACIGKWHLGHKPGFMPNKHGFDLYYGVPYSNDMDKHYYKRLGFQSPPLPVYLNEEVVAEGPDQDSLTGMWTEAAVDFISANHDEPFFLYLAHNMPHTPWHASSSFRGSSARGLYGDVIQELDWSMGELVKTLKDHGIFENTIIIYTSDNGPAIWQKNGGTTGGLRGSKGNTWEGGMRVPGIISWPARIPAGVTCNQPVSTLDLLPTLSALAGVEMQADLVLDGRDIREILFHPGQVPAEEFEMLFYERNGGVEAFRKGDWKIHVAKDRGWTKEEGEFPISLYDLRSDREETINLAEKQPQLVDRMIRELKAQEAEIAESTISSQHK